MHDVHWYKRAADHQVVGIGPLFVTRWFNAVNITLLHDQNAAQREHAKRSGPLLVMAIVDHAGLPKADAVNAEFRDTAQRYSLENQEHVHALAYVIPMDGFVGSIARSVVASITMVLKQPFPTKAFKSADDGVAYLAAHGVEKGVALDTAQALAVLHELRGSV